MAELTQEQRNWLLGIGVTRAAATATDSPTAKAAPTSPTSSFSPFDPSKVQTRLSPEAVQKTMEEINTRDQARIAKERQEAEQQLAAVTRSLADARAFIDGLSEKEVQQASYAWLVKEVRQRFPEAAGLAQWVKDTGTRVPAIRGRLPSPRALMDVIDAGVHARGGEWRWSLGSNKNLATVNTDRLLAAYMAEMPAGVTVKIGAGGAVQLSVEGAALTVPVAGGAAEASAAPAGPAAAFKTGDFSIRVANDGWKGFDPALRAEWKKVEDGARAVLVLRADRDQARVELDQAKKGGGEVQAALQARFEERELAFTLASKKLKEEVEFTATASSKTVTAGIGYLKAKNDQDSVNAGVTAGLDLQTFEGRVQAYYKDSTVEAALAVTAAADKVAATLELAAVKGGVVVTASFEKALDETRAALEVMLRDGKTKIAGQLKVEAEALAAKIQVVHEKKDLKLAAELEKTLHDIRGRIEVEAGKGPLKVKGGASGSSTGEVGGQAQIEIALAKGRSILGGDEKLSFAANVSNKGYKFEVAFSTGEPVATDSLQDLFSTADKQIKELYRLAGDKGIRSIADAEELNRKMREVMAPVEASAKKAKALKGKSQISASLGISVEGEWPAAGKASSPAALFNATIRF